MNRPRFRLRSPIAGPSGPRWPFPSSTCLAALLWLLTSMALPSATLDRATLTQVVNHVTVIDPATRRSHPARPRDLFQAPDVLRTGPDSRAELLAEDQTVARLGSHTIFSFRPQTREIELQKGSILFQSPPGKGGGTIHTPAASAAVLGTTILVAATSDGAMKVLLMEGKGRVQLPDGRKVILRAGQMVTVLRGQQFSQVLDFRLREQATHSLLVQGFRRSLSSQPKIVRAIQTQQQKLDRGQLAPPGGRPPRPGERPPPPGTQPGPRRHQANGPLPLPLPPPPRPGAAAIALDAQREQLPHRPPPPPPRGSPPPPPPRR